jgi:putative transposase
MKPERVVVAGVPYHVTNRGNRREDIFREAEDYRTYLRLLRKAITRYEVRIWSYCLMPNHIHLVAVPNRQDSLGRAMHWAHGKYAEFFNIRYGTVGHLWQGPYRASAMDEHHVLNGSRYVERNPVRAGMVCRAEDYAWSSAAARCGLRRDSLISDDFPLLKEVRDWSSWLAGVESDEELRILRECTQRGYPIGSEEFVRQIEKQSGYRFPRKKGAVGAGPSSPMLDLKFSER